MEPLLWSRQNTLGALVAYSPNSSRIFLGASQNRRLVHIGAFYNHRLLQNRTVNWQYSLEFIPVVLESDPLENETDTITWLSTSQVFVYSSSSASTSSPCRTSSGSASGTVLTESWTITCSRRWSTGEAFSPIGFQWNFHPRHKVQPFAVGHGGFLYTSGPIPVDTAGNFNFTFDFGAGLEFFLTHITSLRFEYRAHHISNDNTAKTNPGIDNNLLQLSWAWGR